MSKFEMSLNNFILSNQFCFNMKLLTCVLVFFCFQFIFSFKLKFNKEKKFKILQFTDLHFGESQENDKLSLLEQTKLIQLEKPDLVVLSGDAVSGHRTSTFEVHYRNLVQPMIQNVKLDILILRM
jgi:predicted MPP superfamily phosphohydrolase